MQKDEEKEGERRGGWATKFNLPFVFACCGILWDSAVCVRVSSCVVVVVQPVCLCYTLVEIRISEMWAQPCATSASIRAKTSFRKLSRRCVVTHTNTHKSPHGRFHQHHVRACLSSVHVCPSYDVSSSTIHSNYGRIRSLDVDVVIVLV